jgi:C4-dicarboxylate transporter DctM subunit
MLTGMPISIALGLTVLTFLFTMTDVPIESVGLKLFSGLDNFGIMAIPFFILAGTFLTRGGVARRMIAFTTSMVGHCRRPGPGRRAACAMFAAISGSSRRHRGGDRLDHDAGDGRARLSEALRRRRDLDLGRARHPGAAVDHPGAVSASRTNTSIGALFMAGIVPGILLALMLAAVTWFIA